jgi:hypothetical protein
MYVRAANRFRLVPPGWISPEYTRTRGCIDGAPERVGMFSTNEIDHVAWFLVLLMGAWIVVNALVDLSGERSERRRKQAADDRLDGKGD